jgi:hypothetical protein
MNSLHPAALDFVEVLSAGIHVTVTIGCTSVHQLALSRCGVIEPGMSISTGRARFAFHLCYINP